MPPLVEPMHEMCGAARCPDFWISSTVASVRSRVEPPAPNVTEKNLGPSCASCARVAASFSAPCGVAGGKNSKLKMRSALPVIRLSHSCRSHFLPGSSKADSAQEMMLYRIAPPTADQKPAT